MSDFIKVSGNQIKNNTGRSIYTLSNNDRVIYEGKYCVCILKGTSIITYFDYNGKCVENYNGNYTSFDEGWYVKKGKLIDNEYAAKSGGSGNSTSDAGTPKKRESPKDTPQKTFSYDYDRDEEKEEEKKEAITTVCLFPAKKLLERGALTVEIFNYYETFYEEDDPNFQYSPFGCLDLTEWKEKKQIMIIKLACEAIEIGSLRGLRQQIRKAEIQNLRLDKFIDLKKAEKLLLEYGCEEIEDDGFLDPEEKINSAIRDNEQLLRYGIEKLNDEDFYIPESIYEINDDDFSELDELIDDAVNDKDIKALKEYETKDEWYKYLTKKSDDQEDISDDKDDD